MTDITFSYDNTHFYSETLSGGIKVQLVFPTKNPIRVVLETRLSSDNPWVIHRNFTANGSLIVSITRFVEGQQFRLRSSYRPLSAQYSTLDAGDSPSEEDFNELTGRVDVLEEAVLNSVNTAWHDLVSLRDAGSLVPGRHYRITDYVTTVANDTEARSAGHPFDVVVLALDERTLSEHAWAMRSERDTEGYFADAKLEAWQLWYCLDNDTTRFQWADSEHGRGVIYRLIDEWHNDCPYDFKNVQFKRYYTNGDFVDNVIDGYDWPNTHYILANGMNGQAGMDYDESDYMWFYTFNHLNLNEYSVTDASLINKLNENLETSYFNQACNYNEMEAYYICGIEDDEANILQALNNIVLSSADEGNDTAVKLYGNEWKTGCYNMTLHEHCYCNSFAKNCFNIVAFKFYYNTFGNGCWYNTFGNGCRYNTFGNHCQYNTFGNDFDGNTFGNDFDGNTFGNDSYGNTFGNDSYGNTFGNGCWYNTFGNDFYGNTFGNYCYYFYVDNNVKYLNVTGGSDDNKAVQNAHILNGTSGKSEENMLTVTIPEVSTVCHYVGLNSDGELKIWMPADLV